MSNVKGFSASSLLQLHGWLTATTKAAGVSPAILARRLNVSRAHAYRLIKGERTLTPILVERWAQALGCTVVMTYNVRPLVDVLEDARHERCASQ